MDAPARKHRRAGDDRRHRPRRRALRRPRAPVAGLRSETDSLGAALGPRDELARVLDPAVDPGLLAGGPVQAARDPRGRRPCRLERLLVARSRSCSRSGPDSTSRRSGSISSPRCSSRPDRRLRGSYETVTGMLLRRSGVRRRPCSSATCAARASPRDARREPRRHLLRLRRRVRASAKGRADARHATVRRGDRRGRRDRRVRLLHVVEAAHKRGVRVRVAPRTTELLIERGEYVPGQGVPLFELRPPIFAGRRVGDQASFDLVVGALIVVIGLPVWLLLALAIKLSSAGPVFYADPADRARRAAVRDAQVPDDGRRRRRGAGGARGGQRGDRARSSRSATTRA